MKYTVAVITVSDMGARGQRVDTSGPALSEMMRAAQKGVFKKNTASRTVSRLAQKIKAL